MWSILFGRTRCGDMPAISCMQARRRCGIGRASDQQLAMSSNASTLCGGRGASVERETERRERGIKILEASRTSGVRASFAEGPSTPANPLGPNSPPSLTCSQRGLCCCIAQQQEPINSSGLCRLTAHTRSRWPMMTRCGDVSVLCCGSRRTCARLPRCHSPSVALAPQCRPHCYSGFLGQLG